MPRVLESPAPLSTGSPQDKHTQNTAHTFSVLVGSPPSLPDLSLLTSQLVQVFLHTVSAGSGVSPALELQILWQRPSQHGSAQVGVEQPKQSFPAALGC